MYITLLRNSVKLYYMITYDNLWKTLKEKGKKKTDLLEIMSPSTLSKLNKNGTITTDNIDKICNYLDCKPKDIINHQTEDEKAEDIIDSLDEATKKSIFEKLKKSFTSGMDFINYKSNDEFEYFKKKIFKDKKDEVVKEGIKKTWEIWNNEEIDKEQ